jgi:hypothetical protein
MADARPIPEAAPVTTAFFPSRVIDPASKLTLSRSSPGPQLPLKSGVRRSAMACTLAEVLGLPQSVLLGLLAVGRRANSGGQIPAQRLADGADGQRRRERDLARQGGGSLAQLLFGDEPVAQTDR